MQILKRIARSFTSASSACTKLRRELPHELPPAFAGSGHAAPANMLALHCISLLVERPTEVEHVHQAHLPPCRRMVNQRDRKADGKSKE